MIDIIVKGSGVTMTLESVMELFFDWAHLLESDIQTILDTSLPNKQQHRAASKLLHDQFVTKTVEFKIHLTSPLPIKKLL